ncbi:MAG TPA: RDD family protein, partial [Candidatus Acidoferrum sp.]|nr:RDD family protein [Candidatus Acidoferrum sp.]
MPRVVAPPPRPAGETISTPPPRAPVPPPAARVTTAPPPAAAPYVFGNPIAYVLARFFAFVLDVLTVALVVTEFAYALIAINPLTGLPTNSETGFDATLGMGVVIALLYVWIAEGIAGTTLWKLAFGLHVYALHGRFVGLGRALIRNVLRPIDLLVIGAVLALLPGHRRLGDLLAGTIVARSPLRGFAPLLGWIGIIILLGLPVVT